MSQDDLIQMTTVTETMFQREFGAIRGILKEEADLRQSLAQLDKHSQAAMIAQIQDCTMKAIGADILWQSWVSKTRRQLNIELAQIMARKIEAMAKVRKAFGRKEAVESLLSVANQERRQKIARHRAEQLSLFS